MNSVSRLSYTTHRPIVFALIASSPGSGRLHANRPTTQCPDKIPLSREGADVFADHVTRLDPGKLTRRAALLQFRRLLRSSRTLGVRVAHGARAGKNLSAGTDPGRSFIPPFSARQPRRNYFAAAISNAPSRHLPGRLRRSRGRTA